MANTYTQIHIHAVFVVQNRQSIISNSRKAELYKYITGIIQHQSHKVLRINGMPDHLHVLFGMRPTQSISDLMQLVKQNSSKWINKKGLVKGKFSWQAGYGAFTHSNSDLPRVIDYIKNQEAHHKAFSFDEEYKNILDDFEINYNEAYLFKPVE
jgi:REP element-mobilizing transposase RayT